MFSMRFTPFPVFCIIAFGFDVVKPGKDEEIQMGITGWILRYFSEFLGINRDLCRFLCQYMLYYIVVKKYANQPDLYEGKLYENERFLV